MIDVEHHDCYVRVLIVKFSTLVHKLSLHFDDAIERLIGDKGLVPNVKLEHGGWVGSVNNCMILSCPGAWVS